MIEFFDNRGVIGTIEYVDNNLVADVLIADVAQSWINSGSDPADFENFYARWTNGYISARRTDELELNDESDALIAAAREDKTNGAMIALVPRDVEQLALDGYEKPDELHLTLFFLGDADEITPTQVNELVTDLMQLVRTQARSVPIFAQAFGVAHWNPESEYPAWVLNVGDKARDDPSGLTDLRVQIEDVLRDTGIDYPPQHSPWQPHICLAYSAEDLYGKLADKLGPVTFDTLRVAWGKYDIDIPLMIGDVVVADAVGIEALHLPGKHDQESHGDPGSKRPAKSNKKSTSKVATGSSMSSADFDSRRDAAAEGDGVYESVKVDDTMDSVERLIDDGKLKGITADQVSDGYQHYTDLGYQTMNAGLRKSNNLSKLSADDRKATQVLDKVIAASPLKTDVIVYRGIVNPERMFGDAYVDSDEENANRGLTWVDDGFTSTSISTEAFENFAFGGNGVAMNILVPKGAHAAGTPDSANENEYEITLPRGTTFRVVSSRRNDEGQMEFDVEVVM